MTRDAEPEPQTTDDTLIDPYSIKHAYQQVADAITARMAGGQYSRKLPTERHLAEEFGVSQVTVGHAMAILRERGLIISVQRRGTFNAAASARIQAERYPQPNKTSRNVIGE